MQCCKRCAQIMCETSHDLTVRINLLAFPGSLILDAYRHLAERQIDSPNLVTRRRM